MALPKVKFSDIPLSTEVDWIHGFLFKNERGWGRYIIRKHPKIRKVFSYEKEDEQVDFLKQYVVQFRENNREVIDKNKDKYLKEWRRVEEVYFKTLSDILEIGWPDDKEIIKAMISINPICPRFLNDWSFSIFFNYKKTSDAMEVIMHECCHFLYFEKWKELYPKMDSKKFESPHLEWHLSEIVAPIVLNDGRIQQLLKQKAVFYPEHEELKIEEKTVPEYFTDLYNRYSKEGKSFDDFLKKAYEVIKKQEIISVF